MKYIEEDNLNISYDYFDNGAGKLAVIFQSNGQSLTLSREMAQNKHLLPTWNKRVSEVCSRYTFFKLFKDEDYDLLILPDTYSQFVGWYVIDNGNDISESISTGIDRLISTLGYTAENTMLFGQSKGGFASLYYGSRLKNVKTIISSMPIVDPGLRFEKLNSPSIKVQRRLMRNEMTDEQLVEFFRMKTAQIVIDDSKDYYLLLGISDENTDQVIDMIDNHNIKKIVVKRTPRTHGGYAAENDTLRMLIKEVRNEI